MAAVNGDELAILLVWSDRSRDVQASDTPAPSVSAAIARRGSWRLPDAIAVQLPKKIDPKGSLPPRILGDATHPVRRWFWSADRQEKGDSQAVVQHLAGPPATPTASPEQAAVRDRRRSTPMGSGGSCCSPSVLRAPSPRLPIALHAWDGGAGESGHWHGLLRLGEREAALIARSLTRDGRDPRSRRTPRATRRSPVHADQRERRGDHAAEWSRSPDGNHPLEAAGQRLRAAPADSWARASAIPCSR